MKKFIYITAFTFLGIIVAFIIHALIEIAAIAVLHSDWEKRSLGLSRDTWLIIRNVWAALIIVLGATIGFRQGKHWWRVIYIDKKS